MKDKIVVRTIRELSYAGEIIKRNNKCENSGVLLKPSPSSEILIWFPREEIKSIITPEGKLFQEAELNDFLNRD